MKRILIFALILMTTFSYAAIYVKQDKAGNIEYTDTPVDGAKEIQVTPLNTVTSNPPVTATTPVKADPSAPQATSLPAAADTGKPVSTSGTYKIFTITSPADGANIQNQSSIPVDMQVEPNMVDGDQIQLYLDGKAAGPATSTTYQELGMIERGSHVLHGEIINATKQVIKRSNSITINVHRNSVITNPGNR